MKKTVSLLLVALFVLSAFCFVGCGKINSAEVSILWSGEGKATNPNSLINSMERAMYIESINYTHYGANGDSAKQLQQAKDAVNNGCVALAVDLIDSNDAQEFINIAKEKNIPIVFFHCRIPSEVIGTYDKCVLVQSDFANVWDVQDKLIADYIKDNFKDLDKNNDNKISGYPFISDISLSNPKIFETVNALLATEDYKVKNKNGDTINTSVQLTDSADLTKAELIVTYDDSAAMRALIELQKSDYNTDKLKTQFVPIFTTGASRDYKAHVLASRPEIPAELVINDTDSQKVKDDKDKKIKELEDLQKYYADNKYLVDLTAVKESDLGEMVYTTLNVIDSGRIAGTAYENYDEISIAVAKIIRNFIKGNDVFKNVASKVKEGETPAVVVKDSTVLVRYTTYGG